jgi:hypothetical protein
MKLKLGILFCICFSFTTFSQVFSLSPDAEVSVLTIGPGTSLNDAFGHNAFRIKDHKYNIDVVYGYGEYDFDAPNFYLKFAQGKLNYLLSKDNFNRFHRTYVYQNRTIREQVLNLTSIEKQKLFRYLENNYKPENRRYLYDFFYNNCATKIRDVAQISLGETISFNNPKNFKAKTFRALIHEHVNRNSWGSFGIDIALGSVIDKEATPNEHMYLPKYIFEFFDTATLKTNINLVKETHIIYQKKDLKVEDNLLLSPLVIMGVLALIILLVTYSDYKKMKRSKILDVVLFAVTGLIGVGLLLLWFATNHSATAQNYNVLWAFPLNLFVSLQVAKYQVKNWVIKYIKFLIIMLCLLTLHWVIGIQVYALGLIPLLIAIGIRYVYLLMYFNQQVVKKTID